MPLLEYFQTDMTKHSYFFVGTVLGAFVGMFSNRNDIKYLFIFVKTVESASVGKILIKNDKKICFFL